jgi:hypothetical protein
VKTAVDDLNDTLSTTLADMVVAEQVSEKTFSLASDITYHSPLFLTVSRSKRHNSQQQMQAVNSGPPAKWTYTVFGS